MGKPLRILRSVAEYRHWRGSLVPAQASIGFVPTMGALHAGHLSLAAMARKETSTVVMSIFVNPAQFAPHEDLARYPRTLESDIGQITASGAVDVLFLPTVADLYPSGGIEERDPARQRGTFIQVLGLSHQLEGSVRPSFFRGVVTVLAKFLNVVRPSDMYLGQKDVQQAIVVGRMMRDLCLETRLRVGPTVRESDGLAMSSRNVYLSPAERARATCLYRGLAAAETAYHGGRGERRGDVLRRKVAAVLEAETGVAVEYVSVADMETLEEVDVVAEGQRAVVSAAVRLGGTRILDNVILDKT